MRAVAPADQAPKSVTVGHYDAARDYQAGLQRAGRPGAGWRERHEELPAVLPAHTAKQVAAAILARADADRLRRRVACGWEGLAIAPGARVRVEGDATLWRVTGWSLEAMAVELELAPIALATASAAADPGTVARPPDLPRGRTVLVAAELPPLSGELPTRPQLTIVAGGTEPGWRGATLMLSEDGGVSWQAAAQLRAPGVVGEVAVPPSVGLASIEDRRSAIVVDLAHADMTLAGALRRRRSMQATIWRCRAGTDPVRWGRANRHRGAGGADAAMAQAAGDGGGDQGASGGNRSRCCGRQRDSAAGTAGAIGAVLKLAPSSVGDTGPLVVSEAAITGASVVPPSPVHLRAAPVEGGGHRLTWVRRSRAGWRWEDAVDAALVEERERYRIRIDGGALVPGVAETDVAALSLPAGTIAAELVQIGTHGASAPATIII